MMNETEKDLPLRHDLARLDRLLAEIVREQEGEAVYHEMRTIPVEAHDRVGTPELSRRLAELSPAAAAALVRACGFYAQLTNLAEDLHHNRRRHAHRVAGSPPQQGKTPRWMRPPCRASWTAPAAPTPQAAHHPTPDGWKPTTSSLQRSKRGKPKPALPHVGRMWKPPV